jgi:hypothetical protein
MLFQYLQSLIINLISKFSQTSMAGNAQHIMKFLTFISIRGQSRQTTQFFCKLVGIGVGVLDRQTYQGGTRGSRLCGEDRGRETENSKVCARTQDTRFIQVRAAKVASPTSCLGDQVWRPALGVGLSPVGLGMCG